MKKVISPILYALGGSLAFGGVFWALLIYEKIFGLHSVFGRMGDLEGLVIMIVVFVSVFFFANIIFQKIKKIERPTFLDNVR